MKKRGYPGPFTAAVTSSTATLAIIIPPSIPMILYAVMAGTSVVQLFVAGIVPGPPRRLRHDGPVLLVRGQVQLAGRADLPVGQALERLQGRVWALTLPIIILGGIFGGIVTATEGAALAVVAALFVGGRDLPRARLGAAARGDHRGPVQTGTVMLLVAASALLGLYLTEVQLPQTHRARR